MDALFLMPNFKEVNAIEIQSIASEIHSASQRLGKGSDALFLLAKENAEAEQQYRKALGTEIVKLKLEGMSVTLIGDIARGNTSDMKFQRDLCEARYTAGRDSLKAIAALAFKLSRPAVYLASHKSL